MKEVIASLVLVALLTLIINPFHFWMTMPAHIMMLGAVAAAFGALSVFALRENANDEREAAHRSFAGRVAFLSGAGVLVLGIAVQSFQHAVDPWLVGVLIVMILGKITARAYGDRYL
jgi:cobalamin synthase